MSPTKLHADARTGAVGDVVGEYELGSVVGDGVRS